MPRSVELMAFIIPSSVFSIHSGCIAERLTDELAFEASRAGEIEDWK